MIRAATRCLSAIAAAAIGFLLISPTATAQMGRTMGAGVTQRSDPIPGSTLFTCNVVGNDRTCGNGNYIYSATTNPPQGGLNYTWTLHTTPQAACPGSPATGTTSPSFCGPTNGPTVCVNPGNDAGRFILKVFITNGFSEATCCLSINVTPSTTTSTPPPATACAGASVQICTTPGGQGPFTYVWRKNDVVVPGATDSCITATAGSAGTVDFYCVTTTGSGNCANSYTACTTLTAQGDTTATPLTNGSACEGQTFQFCTTAGPANGGPFTYSWTKNAVTIPGATDSCFTATAGAPGTVDTYCVTVTGACGPPVTRCGTLTSLVDATASTPPPGSACEGATFQFCTTAGGTGPFTYQWQKNGVDIPGATDSCYTATAGSPPGNVDNYCVTVTGACGAATACTTLTTLFPPTATDRQSGVACEGTQFVFCSTVGGSPPLSISWTKNGVTIPGATNSCYSATAGNAGDIDDYCIIVSNACGTVTQCAVLRAQPNTSATPMANQIACAGDTRTFCTTAGGIGPFTFSWTRNGVTIPGASSSCYTATVPAVPGATDTYCVTVTGQCGPPVVRCATLTAHSTMTATNPGAASECAGQPHVFCTTATGSGQPFTYRWQKNFVTVQIGTNNCYTATAPANPGQTDLYCLTVIGPCLPNIDHCFPLTAIACAGAGTTFTQGTYGDPNAQFNGVQTPQLVEQLLAGDLSVGTLGTASLTLNPTATDANCVVDLLPTNGLTGGLPAFGDEELDPDCQTSPVPIPTVNGKFESVLLGQQIALSLNVRLNGGLSIPGGCAMQAVSFANQGVCDSMTTRTLLPGPDGCMGTADDVPDLLGPDGDPQTPDNLITITLSERVIASLNELTYANQMTMGQTIGGLIELGNLSLTGAPTWTATADDISAALDAVNVVFEGGREMVECRHFP